MSEKSKGEEYFTDVYGKSDSEIVNECARELEEIIDRRNIEMTDLCNAQGGSRLASKWRLDISDEEYDETGFITVERKRSSKRRIRSESGGQRVQKNTNMEMEQIEECKYEISMTAQQNLPKQVALAKLLRDSNIKNINKIKLKGPYRAIIQFEEREHAIKLLKCQKMIELGFRCQMTEETNLSYGVAKGIDLEEKGDEVISNMTCMNDILSAKRLKRLNEEGKWIESETFKLCFKSPTLPPV